MKPLMLRVLSGIAIAMLFTTTAGRAEDRKKTTAAHEDAQKACIDMMHPGMPEEDRKAMREFMRSDRATSMMSRMMRMAREMGNGDVEEGMARMMTMMGSMREGGGMAESPMKGPQGR